MTQVNIDQSFIATLLQENAYLDAIEKGIRAEYVQGTAEAAAFRFIEEYFKEYRALPSIDLVESKFGINLRGVVESVHFWINQIKNRTMYNELNDLGEKMKGVLAVEKAYDAYEVLRDFIKEQEKRLSAEISVCSMESLSEIAIDRYKKASLGLLGIPTPWATLTNWTGGWCEEDVSYVVGGSGVGKTWLAILVAYAAVCGGFDEPEIVNGKKRAKPQPTPTLIISCEQNKGDLATRFFSYKTKKAYQAVHKGTLNYMDEPEFISGVRAFKSESFFDIMDGSMTSNIVDIERIIERTPAKLIVVDAFYKIRPRKDKNNRFENIADVCNDLKIFAQRYKKAIVATSQITREGKKKKEGMGQEDVAFSENLNHNGTNVIGIQRTEENKKDDKATIYPLKVRDGDNSQGKLIVNWNFSYMDFSEPKAGFDNNEDLPF